MDQTKNHNDHELASPDVWTVALPEGVPESYVTESQRRRVLALIETAVWGKRKKQPWREAMLRMFDHAIRAPEQEFGLMFDASVRCWIYGRKPTGNVAAEPLVETFSNIMPARATGWSHCGGHCRKLQVEWTEEVESILVDGAATSEPLVGLVTGSPVDTESLREELRKRAASRSVAARSPEIESLIEGMHSRWTPEDDGLIRAGLADAYRAVERLEHPDAKRLRNMKREAHAALRAVRAQPQAFYATVSKTARVYGVGRNFLGVNSSVRSALLGKTGWAGLDLDKAQLRIAAAKWGGLEDVLKAVEGGDVWRAIMEPAGLWSDDPAELDHAKRIAKSVVYGAVFGSNLSQTVRRLRREERLEKGAVHKLVQGELVTRLYAAAKGQLDALMAGQERIDAFGHVLKVDQDLTGHAKRREARSKLAEWVQSFEVAIMLGAGVYAKAWLHDGVWVSPGDVSEAVAAIEERAKMLDVSVKVEVTESEARQASKAGPPAATSVAPSGEAGCARHSPIHTTKIANVGRMNGGLKGAGARGNSRRGAARKAILGFGSSADDIPPRDRDSHDDPFSYDWALEALGS